MVLLRLFAAVVYLATASLALSAQPPPKTKKPSTTAVGIFEVVVERRSFLTSVVAGTVVGVLTQGGDWANALDEVIEEDPIATWAYRNSGVDRRVAKVNLGTILRCEDRLQPPPNSKRRVSVSLEFPADWLELDRINQGIQYVDQRNGDKLYVFAVPLPAGTSLLTVPKIFLGQAIFNPQSSLVQSGASVEDFKITSSKDVTESSGSKLPRRRLQAKYATVTGSGLRVERRGLIDAYEVDGYAYILLTSSNAVKFEAKGIERETVEKIAESFRIEVV
jgi:hypothetical protein